jgi:hypothetical protein
MNVQWMKSEGSWMNSIHDDDGNDVGSDFGNTINSDDIDINHYKKSCIFKMFNLIKMFILTKRMSTLIKSMGHERHMVLLVGSFN